MTADESGEVRRALEAILFLADEPLASGVLAQAVERSRREVAELLVALGEELDFHGDQQASEAMRRHLARVLFVRCLSRLLGRADLGSERTGG